MSSARMNPYHPADFAREATPTESAAASRDTISLKLPTTDTYIFKLYFPFGDSAAYYMVDRKLGSFVLQMATEGA